MKREYYFLFRFVIDSYECIAPSEVLQQWNTKRKGQGYEQTTIRARGFSWYFVTIANTFISRYPAMIEKIDSFTHLEQHWKSGSDKDTSASRYGGTDEIAPLRLQLSLFVNVHSSLITPHSHHIHLSSSYYSTHTKTYLFQRWYTVLLGLLYEFLWFLIWSVTNKYLGFYSRWLYRKLIVHYKNYTFRHLFLRVKQLLL